MILPLLPLSQNVATPYLLTKGHNVLNLLFCIFSDTTACYADQDDDIIFEDFARLRLKGETDG